MRVNRKKVACQDDKLIKPKITAAFPSDMTGLYLMGIYTTKRL